MKKTIFALIAAVLVLSGCGKDFLERAPKMSQSDVLTLSTFDGLDLSTAGAYAPMASNSWYGAHFILDNEMATSNGKRWGILIDKYESGRYKDEYSVLYTPGSTSPLWSVAYYVISAANNVINAIDAEGAQFDASEQDLKNLKAECLFLRAFSHFDLVRTYAMPYNYKADASHYGVPYVYVSDSEAKPARETVKTVYDNIIKDLLDAESMIDPAYVRSGVKDPKATVTIDAIRALLARAYQYSEQWQKAAEYATKVINSGNYELWTKDQVKNAKVYGVDVPEGGEVIFQIYNGLSQSYGTGNETVWGMTSYVGYGDCGVSMDLINLFEDGDVRKTCYSPDTDGNAMFTLKYFGKGLGALDATNVIVLRLSEMYLIRAEAGIRGATGTSPVADLNAIAEARGATPQPATPEGVFTECQKEFAWEGHLWFDLARTGRDMVRTDISGNVPTKIAKGDYRWAKPLPRREFTVNPNLEPQNDGYSKE